MASQGQRSGNRPSTGADPTQPQTQRHSKLTVCVVGGEQLGFVQNKGQRQGLHAVPVNNLRCNEPSSWHLD